MSRALTLAGVRFAYGSGPPVVRDVDLSVAPGTVHGLVGPNGSGKSTLLRLMAGLVEPDSGEVALDGRPLGRLPRREVAGCVALVPQNSALAFPFTVAELVLLGRTPHHGRPWFDSARDLATARAAMEATDVLALADRPFQTLSGGERQRVVIARALCQEPSVLLLDEPTAHLDLRHQVRLLGLVRRRSEAQGLTSVVVLHDLNLAGLGCDVVTVLRAGAMVASGAPGAVLTVDLVGEVFGVRAHRGEVPGSAAPWFVPVGVAGGDPESGPEVT